MPANATAPTQPAGRRIRGLDAAERAAHRRTLLLDSALELFARHGYANTSIETLCQTAYVGNKAFYEHFASKEECFLELLRRCTQTLFDAVGTALASAPDDEDAGIRAIVTAFTRGLGDDPRVIIVLFGHASGISPAIERVRRENRRLAAATVMSIWERYARPGDVVGTMPLAIATVGGLFDQVSDLLDRTECSPTVDDIAELTDDMIYFALTVRGGIRN